MVKNICIIGGGIGGCVTAIKLSNNADYKISLFEKDSELLNLPYCHLHAGGFLYPQLPLDECKELLIHSLLFANFFKNCLEKRPTIIAYSKNEVEYSPENLFTKAKFIQNEYKNYKNLILGKPEDFYAIYTKSDVIFYKKNGYLKKNNLVHDIYVGKFCKELNDIESIQYPFISVNEYGISMIKIREYINVELDKKNISVYNNCKIEIIKQNEMKWIINNEKFDYLINSCGYEVNKARPNEIKKTYEFLELKSSWVIKTKVDMDYIFPEITIIGKRGTENGMIQISPLNERNVFQIHLMTNESTLFNGSLVLDKQVILQRTDKTISEISKVFKMFKDAEYYSEPMWGIQRIANLSKEKRADSAIFNYPMYAEIQIVKGISSVFCANEITKKIRLDLSNKF